MTLRVVNGTHDAAYAAELVRLAELLTDSSSVVCVYTKGGERRMHMVGEVDFDATAGFVARCMVIAAEEE